MRLVPFCKILERLSVALFLIILSFFASHGIAAPLGRSQENIAKNAADIAVIDRVLATVKPGQTSVTFGDVGMRLDNLKLFRQRLVAEERKSAEGIAPNAATPPGTAFEWPGGIVPFRFDPTQVSNGTITAAEMQQFRDSVAEWAAFANLQFNEFTGTTPTNFVTVQENALLGEGGYSSSVGMAGGGCTPQASR